MPPARDTAFVIQTRMMDEATTARYLGFPSVSAFRAARPRLDALAFPKPVAELGGTFDRVGIDDWIDAISQDGLVFSG